MIEIIQTIQHDTSAFTQGYFFKDGYLYESTGLHGRSSLRKIDPNTGDIINHIDIDKKYFSEGIECYKDKIYMLTWKEQTCKVFDLNFNEVNQFNYSGEGWGLSLLGENFCMSDGTNNIKIVNPENFNVLDNFNVFEGNKPLNKLNELQVVNDCIFANIWFSDTVVVLKNKSIDRFIDLSILRKYLKNRSSEAMNGIAYDINEKVFYITGKLWDLSFKIKIL